MHDAKHEYFDLKDSQHKFNVKAYQIYRDSMKNIFFLHEIFHLNIINRWKTSEKSKKSKKKIDKRKKTVDDSLTCLDGCDFQIRIT